VALHASSAARFGLLHSNVPGVLARVDALVGEHGLNVDGQVLATRGQLGYVVTDVNGDMPAALLASLRALPETVRLMTCPGAEVRKAEMRQVSVDTLGL
jgi:D-3-phosphoglycerate dehydrogenase